MTNRSLDLTNTDFLDSEALSDDCIELSSAQLDRAAQLSRSTPAAQQWQAYLDALALFGFQEWLEEWAIDLRLDSSTCFKSQPAPFVGASCLQVGQLKLCLITTSSILNPAIDFPSAIVDLPQFVPHLYVLAEVNEEQMQVQIYGYLWSNWLMQHRQSLIRNPIDPVHPQQVAIGEPSPSLKQPNPTYTIPLDWFTLDPAALLVNLRCLELEPKKSAINVGDWLNDRLDEVAQGLNAVLLPLLIPATALRSAQELQLAGVQIPPTARGVSFDLQIGDTALRLSAVTWVLSPAIESFSWTLLLVLNAQPQSRLSIGLRLQVRDAAQLLVEQVLSQDSPDAVLYAHVGGDRTDQFEVTIDLPSGETLALPPFVFYL